MRPYAERRATRVERLRTGAARALVDAQAAFERADAIARIIPLGQPVLVGHHSEKRHRRDLARIDSGMRKGVEESKHAEELERRANAPEANRAISSDDPEAIAKLKEKLTQLLAKQAHDVAINRTIRTAKRTATARTEPWEPIAIGALKEMGLSERLAEIVVRPDFAGRVGMADYELRNNGAEIRRTEKRTAELTERATHEAPPIEIYGDVRIEEAENRVRIYFPGKPAETVRSQLKSGGFRWSPTEGAWQRMASNDAWHVAHEMVKKAGGHDR
jgi:hypothetical protein